MPISFTPGLMVSCQEECSHLSSTEPFWFAFVYLSIPIYPLFVSQVWFNPLTRSTSLFETTIKFDKPNSFCVMWDSRGFTKTQPANTASSQPVHTLLLYPLRVYIFPYSQLKLLSLHLDSIAWV